MASSLFPTSGLFPNQNPTNNGNILGAIQRFKSAMQGNPQALFDNMMQNNPQFRQFAQSMQGKTPEEAFRQFGLDFDEVKGILK